MNEAILVSNAIIPKRKCANRCAKDTIYLGELVGFFSICSFVFFPENIIEHYSVLISTAWREALINGNVLIRRWVFRGIISGCCGGAKEEKNMFR